MKTRYTLAGPCANCPFRNDQPAYLRPERIREIGEALLFGQDFWCHKTVDHGDDADECSDELSTYQPSARTRACGGAMATLHNEGKATQMEQITERLGFPVAVTDPDSPVFSSIAEWMTEKTRTVGRS